MNQRQKKKWKRNADLLIRNARKNNLGVILIGKKNFVYNSKGILIHSNFYEGVIPYSLIKKKRTSQINFKSNDVIHHYMRELTRQKNKIFPQNENIEWDNEKRDFYASIYNMEKRNYVVIEQTLDDFEKKRRISYGHKN